MKITEDMRQADIVALAQYTVNITKFEPRNATLWLKEMYTGSDLIQTQQGSTEYHVGGHELCDHNDDAVNDVRNIWDGIPDGQNIWDGMPDEPGEGGVV